MRTINEVGNRARKSIRHSLKKLTDKYGNRAVRLVTLKYFSRLSEENKLKKEIEFKEKELNKLKRKKT